VPPAFAPTLAAQWGAGHTMVLWGSLMALWVRRPHPPPQLGQQLPTPSPPRGQGKADRKGAGQEPGGGWGPQSKLRGIVACGMSG